MQQYEHDDDDINALPVDEDYVPPPAGTAATLAPVYAFPAPQRSAGLLRWGIALLIIGLAGSQLGASMTLDWMAMGGRGDNAGYAVSIIAFVGVAVGLACTLQGIRRLATSVDYIAFRTHLQEHGTA